MVAVLVELDETAAELFLGDGQNGSGLAGYVIGLLSEHLPPDVASDAFVRWQDVDGSRWRARVSGF